MSVASCREREGGASRSEVGGLMSGRQGQERRDPKPVGNEKERK